MENVALPSSVVWTGPEATELVVAFRVSQGMSEIAVGVEEASEEVVVRVAAAWSVPEDASGGWFPYLTYTSAVVGLAQPLGTRRVRAVPDSRHGLGVV
jgi:hypothetical protein